jgi:biopolymer transport protein ExbD
VLLAVLMVMASYAAGLGIPRPPRTFRVSIDAHGVVFVDAEPVDEAGLRAHVQKARQQGAALVASIAADGRASHAQVLRVVDVLRKEWVEVASTGSEP